MVCTDGVGLHPCRTDQKVLDFENLAANLFIKLLSVITVNCSLIRSASCLFVSITTEVMFDIALAN